MHFQCMLRLSEVPVQHLLADINFLPASSPPQRRPASHIHRLLSIALRRVVRKGRFFLLNFYLLDAVIIRGCFRHGACLFYYWNLLDKLEKVNRAKAWVRFGMSCVLVLILPRISACTDNDHNLAFVPIALSALEPEFMRIHIIKSYEEMLTCLTVDYQESLCEAMLEHDVPFTVVCKEIREVIHDLPSNLRNLKIPLTFQTPYLALPVMLNLCKLNFRTSPLHLLSSLLTLACVCLPHWVLASLRELRVEMSPLARSLEELTTCLCLRIHYWKDFL